LQPVRELTLEFLNTTDDGRAPSEFGQVAAGSDAYDARVRGAVALLRSLYTFSQQ
jgi:hypothetical protein